MIDNYFSDPIQMIWKSEQAKTLRLGFSDNATPNKCKECSLYHAIDLGFGTSNLRKYKPTDGLYYVVEVSIILYVRITRVKQSDFTFDFLLLNK